MTLSSVVVTAPAKINLYLAVTAGVRPDGYHAVTTVLQALELADEITVAPAERLTVECDPALDIPAGENLVYRAAVALGEALGQAPAYAFRVTKRIPAGAGLGGGSSDAAAALAGMAALLGIEQDDPRLTRVARSLGADVPFFLAGGTALFGGRGDELVRALPTLPCDVALIKPVEAVSTAEAYSSFDRLPATPAPGPRHVTDALRFQDRDALAASLYNNMTGAAGSLVASVCDALALCQAAEGVLGCTVCGSGSAVFALCEDAAAAEALAAQATDGGFWGTTTRTSATGITVRSAEEHG